MLIILLSLFAGSSSLSCLNSAGAPKDYWIMIKAPQIAAVPPLPGKSYMYIDATTMTKTFSPNPLNVSSPLTATLNQLNLDPEISFIFYE